MSRLLYYIWLFTLYPIRPYAYPICPKLLGNLTPVFPTLSDYLPARRPIPGWLRCFPTLHL